MFCLECGFVHAVAVDFINQMEIAENCKSSRKNTYLAVPGSILLQSTSAHGVRKGWGSFPWHALILTNLFKADASSGLCRSREGKGLGAAELSVEHLSCLSGGRVWGACDPGDRGALPGLCDARSTEDVFRD